jgi:hypothetical protein
VVPDPVEPETFGTFGLVESGLIYLDPILFDIAVYGYAVLVLGTLSS